MSQLNQNEVKLCPLCGKAGDCQNGWVHCSSNECFLFYTTIELRAWQNRPLEDALEEKIDDLHGRIEELQERNYD